MRVFRNELLILLMVLGVPLTVLGIEMEPGTAPDAPNTSPRVVEQNGVSFTSSGAGKEEQAPIEQIQGRYNLRVTTSTNSGQYTIPSELRIEDHSGKALVSTQPEGPIFLAKMPPGEYTVYATAEGTTQTRKVSVPATGQAPITFTWPMREAEPRNADAP